jgi:hypothetical protein
MAEERKALDLDELFGQARALKVKWNGKEYELLQLEALGPKSISQFQALQKKTQALQMVSISGEITDEQDREIVELFDQMLAMLCKDLPVKEMPFAAKSRTLEFYVTETQGKNALDIAQMKAQTGAMSSQG